MYKQISSVHGSSVLTVITTNAFKKSTQKSLLPASQKLVRLSKTMEPENVQEQSRTWKILDRQ